MDLSVRASRRDGGRTLRVAQRAAALTASTWHAPKQRRLALALAAAVLAATAFARIAEDYLTNDPLARWDLSFARWLSGERGNIGTDVFRALSFVGSPAVALAIGIIACVMLYRRGRVIDAAFLPVVLGGAELLNLILKLVFHRTRPEVGVVHLDTYSFPSGHAMISTTAYGALVYLAWGPLRARRERLLVTAATAVFVALICFSRLYLGAHYLSDVLAGVAGGAFWLAVSIALQTIYGERFARHFVGSRVDRLARRITRS
jgi:membrane-associated phospholipid phosphatase